MYRSGPASSTSPARVAPPPTSNTDWRRPAVVAAGLALHTWVAPGCAAQGPGGAGPAGHPHVAAAIAAAEALGAGEHPVAAEHLRRAREALDLAERLAGRRERARGERLAHRAEADAALALALARQGPARALADDALEQLRALEAAVGPTVRAEPAEPP